MNGFRMSLVVGALVVGIAALIAYRLLPDQAHDIASHGTGVAPAGPLRHEDEIPQIGHLDPARPHPHLPHPHLPVES
ncbi:MAG: hypothetical protein IT196_03650 [Acidimicrobiales bacterium]|nr:hypothetical protein [Acidimicrobiales bacterium]